MEDKFPQHLTSDASLFTDADPFAADANLPSCVPQGAAPADGYHFPGEDCITCHQQAGGAPPFTVGGTLYSDEVGSAPAPGVTIVIDDFFGNRFSMVTEENGNFYSIDPITFPIKTYLAVCPTIIPMLSNVPQASASCNSAACHTAGFRVHLP